MNLSEYDTSKIGYPEEFETKYASYFAVPITNFTVYGVDLKAPYNKMGKYDVGLKRFARLNAYEEHFRKFFKEYDDILFSQALKYIWLRSKFKYFGKTFDGDFSDHLASAYGTFLRRFVGYTNKIYFYGVLVPTVLAFVDKLYGKNEFYKHSNPLETPPVQPFRNISLCHYAVVREMDEALQLLKYADDRKMLLYPFLDYVLNYVNCYNAKYGDKYLFLENKSELPGAVIKLEGGSDFSTKWLEGVGKTVLNDKPDGNK